MMKKLVKIARITIVALLISAIIWNEKFLNPIITLAIGVGVCMLGYYLFLYLKDKILEKDAIDADFKEEFDSSSTGKVLLYHVNARITEKLQTTYPKARWDWDVDEPINIICNKGVGKIKLFDAGEFNFANVKFLDFSAISLELMQIKSFEDISTSENVITPDPIKVEKVDVDAWYSINAQNLLSEIITDLNTKGGRKIFINEDGSIYSSENDLEPELQKIENMPERKYWDKIIGLNKNDGLNAVQKEKVMQVSW